MSSAAVSLPTLPAEIIVMIADKLAVQDLARFRVTCVHIKGVTASIFSKWVFIELKSRVPTSCQWTKEVLEKLTPTAFNAHLYRAVVVPHFKLPSTHFNVPYHLLTTICFNFASHHARIEGINYAHDKDHCFCQVE